MVDDDDKKGFLRHIHCIQTSFKSVQGGLSFIHRMCVYFVGAKAKRIESCRYIHDLNGPEEIMEVHLPVEGQHANRNKTQFDSIGMSRT